jgi:hypothetical protein
MVVIVAACLTIVQIHLNLVKYNKNDVIKWDVAGYYSYLPAVFIDKDISLQFVTAENNRKDEGVKYWYLEDEYGNRLIKYPMGMSVLYAPFFFTAHALAIPLGYTQDGFSDIYDFFIEFSGLFYLLLGLWFLRKLLLKYYSEYITASCLMFIFFGTNLLYYSTVEPAMSHAYTFSLFSIFLYYVSEFYEKLSFRNVIALSVCFGLIILVRPLNVLFIIPFLLYGVKTREGLKQRISFFVTQYKYLLVLVSMVFVILLPQLLYYRYVTGSYFVFSYGKEQFYFNRLHLPEFLFSFRKGWLIYTPIMAFALYGVWHMKEYVWKFRYSVCILVPLYIYLLSSWWCWWYGGSFSQRSMIDLYPLLALPLAAFLYKVSGFRQTKKYLIYAILLFCLLLNVFQTVQYKYNIIDYDGMTVREYAKVFGTIDPLKIDTALLDKPDYESAVRGLPE